MVDVKISEANWQTEGEALRLIREQVFVVEQQVPKELEWDNFDEQCVHLLAKQGDEPIGCARIIIQNQDAKLGRIAVLANYRGLGVGRHLMTFAETLASKHHLSRISLSAQCHAFQFYHQLGYYAENKPPYDDANIPHIDMSKPLDNNLPNQKSFVLGTDLKYHHADNQIETIGLLDMLLSQTQRAMILCVKNLNHPICHHPNIIERIKFLAKDKPHFKVYLLINSFQHSDTQHPFIQLQRRLPSHMEIRQCKSAITTRWLFDNTGWFNFENNNARAHYSDRPSIHHFMERFNIWWRSSKPVEDTRDVYL